MSDDDEAVIRDIYAEAVQRLRDINVQMQAVDGALRTRASGEPRPVEEDSAEVEALRAQMERIADVAFHELAPVLATGDIRVVRQAIEEADAGWLLNDALERAIDAAVGRAMEDLGDEDEDEDD